MEESNSEFDAVLSLLHHNISESPHLREMVRIWTEIGVSSEQREARIDTLVNLVKSLLQDMASGEVELVKEIEKSVEINKADLIKLCEQLSLPKEEIPCEKTMGLLQREPFIRGRVDALMKVKFDRQKRLKRIIEMEASMCKSLGERAKLASIYKNESIPSEQDLLAHRERVEELQFILDERRTHFADLCSRVHRIWAELEEEPHGYFFSAPKQKDMVFSTAEIAKMDLLYQQIVSEAAQLESKASELRAKIQSLWSRLNIPEDERSAFNENYQGFKPKVITILTQEFAKLNDLKHANMKLIIDNTRNDLHIVWDKCFYGEAQRHEFYPAFSDEYDEETLGDLESELDKMTGFYSDNKELFDKVQKREEMWAQYVGLVAKNSDPSRLFNTRGGQLLKNQQLQAQVKRELNKLEKSLNQLLGQWEEDCERHFIVHDSRYLDTITTQWEETGKQKEKEKEKRAKENKAKTELEMTYGSKPSTPLKKILKRPAASPLTVPAKLRKVGQSPSVNSTRNMTKSANRPPRATIKAARNARTPMCTPQKRSNALRSRRVLGDKNTQPAQPDPSAESFFSQINASLASSCSYTDFKIGASSQPRSSVIPRTSSKSELS